jgi:hypothetical protein
MSVMPMTRAGLPRPKLVLIPVAQSVEAQRILSVEFRAPDGHSWQAIGGGETLAAAIDSARESCPDGTNWEPVDWSDLYGD